MFRRTARSQCSGVYLAVSRSHWPKNKFEGERKRKEKKTSCNQKAKDPTHDSWSINKLIRDITRARLSWIRSWAYTGARMGDSVTRRNFKKIYNSDRRKETGKEFYKCSRIMERFDLAIEARYFSLAFLVAPRERARSSRPI